MVAPGKTGKRRLQYFPREVTIPNVALRGGYGKHL